MDPSSLPSDTVQWWTAVRRQLRFYLRTWRFVGLLIFVMVVTTAFTALSIYYGDSGASANSYLYGVINSLPTFGIIIGAFIGGDAIAMDFGSGTGYFMLVLPVRRVVLLLGRYAAAFLASFALILVYYAYAIAGASWFYGLGGLPWLDVAESIGLAALFALAVLATAFLFSAFFRSPAISIVVTILVLFLAFTILDGAIAVTGVEPFFSLPYSGGVLALVFQSAPHHVISSVASGRARITIHTWNPYIWEGVVIMLVYLGVGLGLSSALYQYKESKG